MLQHWFLFFCDIFILQPAPLKCYMTCIHFQYRFCIWNFMTLLNGSCRRCDNYQKGLCCGFPALLVQQNTYAHGLLHFLAFLIPCHPGAKAASRARDSRQCQCRQAQCLLKATLNGQLYENPSKMALSWKRPSMASHSHLVFSPTVSYILVRSLAFNS